MSDYRTRAADCLGKAEKQLQELLGKAAQEGDYNATLDLSRAAQEVARVAGLLAGTNGLKKEARAAAVNSLSPVYPKYYREGDRLVVVGKQKKADGEYQHKCPKAFLDTLVAALLMSPMPITAKDNLRTQLTGHPPYRLDNCLRWMRGSGLIKKHGHNGYEVLDREHFEANVAMHWNRLPAS